MSLTSAFETASLIATPSALEKAAADLERVQELRGRIRSMQRVDIDPALPTLPALAPLLPGGALRAGGSYSVTGSLSLVMGLLAAPSAEGSWCGVVGVPEFGAEAAARLGVDLSRLVLVPRPGRSWFAVTAALADALAVVAVRPRSAVSETDAARLRARLRQRGAALVTLGDWPGVEARLSVEAISWSGIGRGHGYPREHAMTVLSRWGDRSRSARLVLGDGFRAEPRARLEAV